MVGDELGLSSGIGSFYQILCLRLGKKPTVTSLPHTQPIWNSHTKQAIHGLNGNKQAIKSASTIPVQINLLQSSMIQNSQAWPNTDPNAYMLLQ